MTVLITQRSTPLTGQCGQPHRFVNTTSYSVKGKSKVFPYSLPSFGPAADPGVQAVSPQVT